MNNKPEYIPNFDSADIEYFLEVYDRLLKRTNSDFAKEILLQSSLINRLKEDAEHVHHQDPEYWADLSIEQYVTNNKLNMSTFVR